MFENGVFVPYQDKNGKWNLGLGTSNGYVSYFDQLSTTDLTTNFNWDFTKAYVPPLGSSGGATNGKVNYKDATTGEVKEAFANELSKLLVADPNGNLGVKASDKVKYDKIIEGVNKVLGLASNIWDTIVPERIAQRTGSNITNNNTGTLGSGTDGILPVNKNTSNTGSGSGFSGAGGGGSGSGFNFTQFITDNIYLVAVLVGVLIYAFFPSGESPKSEKQSGNNSTLIYAVLGIVLVLVIPKLTTTATA